MQRMSSLDAGFFFAENDRTPLQFATVGVFEGELPSYGDLVRLIMSKLPQVPKYRQRVRRVPFNLARPVWTDDQHFQVLYHVRHTAVPKPGGAEELRNLAGRILAQRLDLSRPLWEAWLVEGLEGGRWALLIKMHHCMADGVGSSELVERLFDRAAGESQAETEAEPPPWTPEQEPSALSLMLGGVRDTAADVIRQAVRIPGYAQDLGTDIGFAGGLPRYAASLLKPAAPSLNGPTSPHRRWSWLQADLDEVKRTGRALGGTVNDVILAAVAAGFRDLLRSRGVRPDDTIVRTMVPVSVRSAGEKNVLTNRVSAVLVNLPCGEPDPVRRIHLVREQMGFLKDSHQAIGPDALQRGDPGARCGSFAIHAVGGAVQLTHAGQARAYGVAVPGPPVTEARQSTAVGDMRDPRRPLGLCCRPGGTIPPGPPQRGDPRDAPQRGDPPRCPATADAAPAAAVTDHGRSQRPRSSMRRRPRPRRQARRSPWRQAHCIPAALRGNR